MAAFLLRRLGFMILTLFLLSLIIFFAGQVVPGDPGRAVLGPFAANSAVQALDHSLGVDKPLVTRYLSWLGGLLHGDLGKSYAYQSAVAPFVRAALINSIKLAALAFVIVVPLGIVGGVIAAFYEGRSADRVISVTGLSLTSVPEFVSGIVLIVIFGVTLKWLPVTASAGAGAGVSIDLVQAHKWFNIAAMRGHANAGQLRREIAEQMSDSEIGCAQRAARDWLKAHPQAPAPVVHEIRVAA